jgi:hypothetical protein
MAQIKSLPEMEKIVSRNKMLGWDGWTVLHTFASPTGWRSKEGVRINEVWHIQRRFDVGAEGWDIPPKLVR